uniref:SET domain-containing protein n=1 Tax=Denticeps clupeoides TaxID=299321 RepID=A0AAY4CSJ5_9TELE
QDGRLEPGLSEKGRTAERPSVPGVLALALCRGVFAESDIFKGDFILEYRGDLIDPEETFRSFIIAKPPITALNVIDAARDDGTLGRLVNDDHINPNCKMKRIMVEGKPHLCLFALKDITPGDEIRYNYGDADCPWRNQVRIVKDILKSDIYIN